MEDFLGLPVGTSVPSGYYAPSQGSWLASGNGIILKIISVTASAADVDVTGDGVADTGAALASLGISDLERQTLATVYTVGQTLWRTPMGHFTSFHDGPNNGGPPGTPDAPTPCTTGAVTTQCNPVGCFNTSFCGAGVPTWAGCHSSAPTDCYYTCCPPGYAPSGGLCVAGSCDAPDPPPPPQDGPGNCDKDNASTIGCQRQSLGEDIALPGTPYSLHYQSDRQRGYAPTTYIPISHLVGGGSPTGIAMRVSIAGELFTQAFGPLGGQNTTFTWDGKDAYGRLIQGSQPVSVQLSCQYKGVYQNSSAFGMPGNGTPIAASQTRLPFQVTKNWASTIEHWDAQPQGLGGWTLSVHHTYDVSGRILRLGDGTNRTLRSVPPVIQTVAGTGAASASGDGGPATTASVSSPQSVAIGPTGRSTLRMARAASAKSGPTGSFRRSPASAQARASLGTAVRPCRRSCKGHRM